LPGFRKSCREIGRGAQIEAATLLALLETMDSRINLVKVFSATKSRDRNGLGERVTAWIEANPEVRILTTVVLLTSDSGFHCLSMILIGAVGGLS